MRFRILLWLSLGLPCLLLAQVGPKNAVQSRDSVVVKPPGHDPQKLDTVEVKRNIPLQQQLLDRVRISPRSNSVLLNGNTFDVLNNIPSLQIDELGNLALQGKMGVLVTIDGKQTHLTGTALISYLKSIPATSVANIDLMSIPPAKWSAEGYAGVIDIRTKMDVLKGLKGTVFLGESKGRLWKYNNGMLIQYGTKKWTINSGFSIARSSNYFDVARERQLVAEDNEINTIAQHNQERNHALEMNARIGLEYRISKNSSIELNWNFLQNNYKELGDYQTSFSNAGDLFQSTSSWSNLRNPVHKNSANLHYDYAAENKKTTIQWDVDYLNYTSNRWQDLTTMIMQRAAHQRKDEQLLYSNNPFVVDLCGIKTDFQRKFEERFGLEAGFQLSRSARSSRGYYKKGETDQNLRDADALESAFRQVEYLEALYTDFQIKLKQWEFKLGLRTEYSQFHNEINDVYVELGKRKQTLYLFPTLFGIYKINKENNKAIQIAYGRRIVRPNYQDLNPAIFFFDANTSYQGNAHLVPQLTDNMELKYVHGQRWNIGVTFLNHRNYISMIHQLNEKNYAQTYQNIEAVRSAAISLNGGQEIFKSLTLYGFGQIQYIHYKNTPDKLNNLSIDRNLWSFQSNLMIQVKLPHKLTINWTNSYRTNVLYAQTVIKPLYQMHLAINKQFSNNLSLALTIRDLFHTNVIKREIVGDRFNIRSKTINDSQIVGLNFNYTFGLYQKQKAQKTSLETEVSRM
ncbi:outer membrane beta-barrel family protein [Sphingobacterium sp. HMA12]|uniref:outer membrane beta-barrel family protein n=1 Tax=Sphingobacterium sp. HMA12 TaxID=2050894 RepID=UPI000CEA13C1|nr:outer membrane beta-barrel family protein [Sphingobacterium sp. HMA12]